MQVLSGRAEILTDEPAGFEDYTAPETLPSPTGPSAPTPGSDGDPSAAPEMGPVGAPGRHSEDATEAPAGSTGAEGSTNGIGSVHGQGSSVTPGYAVGQTQGSLSSSVTVPGSTQGSTGGPTGVARFRQSSSGTAAPDRPPRGADSSALATGPDSSGTQPPLMNVRELQKLFDTVDVDHSGE
jgi:hypothetical protein